MHLFGNLRLRLGISNDNTEDEVLLRVRIGGIHKDAAVPSSDNLFPSTRLSVVSGVPRAFSLRRTLIMPARAVWTLRSRDFGG